MIGAVLAPGSPTGSRLWGEELGPAAMLACVLVVGIVHTAWSDGGFVDGTFVDHARPALWRELADWRDERSVDGGNEPAARQD
ncbi:hypothetical protein [Burkholderia arboris]|uniref:hypothetical protein n=1 Tax=Burkholderia arboris TaxID=488730 RepID=UPI00292A4341|nr:hypothetical protein [Burkholderia arboris]